MAIKNILNLGCKTNSVKFKLGSKNADMYRIPLPKNYIYKEYKNGLMWWNQDYRLTCPVFNKVPKVKSDLDNNKKFIQAFTSTSITYMERKNKNELTISLFLSLYFFDPFNTEKYFLYFIEPKNITSIYFPNSCKEIKYPIICKMKISGMFYNGKEEEIDECDAFIYSF